MERPPAHLLELLRRNTALAAERRRPPVVLREQRDALIAAVAGAVLQEGAHLEMLPRADRLGEHSVRHVADQHVLEGELPLATHRPPLDGGDEDVLLLQRHERVAQVPTLRGGQSGQRALGERAPDHRCLLHQPALEGVERVKPRGQHRLHGVWQLRRLDAALLRNPAGHLLGEQRVAAGALGHRRHNLLALGEQRPHECTAVLVAEGVEEQLGRGAPSASPAAAPVEQFVAREADEHERRPHPLCQVLDRVEQAVVGPVDVLERDHERVPVGDRLDAAAQCREERLAQALRVVLVWHQLGGHVHAEQPSDQRRLAVGHLADAAHQLTHV